MKWTGNFAGIQLLFLTAINRPYYLSHRYLRSFTTVYQQLYRIGRPSFTTSIGTAVTGLVHIELFPFLYFRNYIEQVCK